MNELRTQLERAARQVEEPDAFDQLRHRRSVRQRRRRIGIAALALAIAAGGIGMAAVALDHGTSAAPGVVPGTHPGSASPSAAPGVVPATGSPALCSNTAMRVSIQSSTGAAGTIRTVWRAENISGKACRSFGYPGMDVRGPHGWLNLHVIRGGRSHPDISQPPQRIVVAPGHSLYFTSYWVDVTTNAYPSCTRFDRVKVTLPDNRVSNVLSAAGLSNNCLNPDSVDVGPVTTTAPRP